MLAAHGHQVTIFDNLSTGHRSLAQEFPLTVADVGDGNALAPALKNIDAVMHFAAASLVGESVKDPKKYFHNNVINGIGLLDAAVTAGVKAFIFSSTAAVYGIPEKVPITEDAPCRPVNPYGSSKVAFENAMHAYGRAYDLRFASLRYFNASGADESGAIGEMHDPETHLIPNALHALASGDEFQLFGDDYATPDGTCIRDYIHVNDLADAHVLALEYLAGGGESAIWNLGTGHGHSNREVLDSIEKVTGRKLKVKVAPRREGDPPVLVADPSRAMQALAWKPLRNLEQIVSTAWKWEQTRRK